MNQPNPSTALTRFAGRAGDRNDRAMTVSALLADALAARLATPTQTIGTAQPALSASWRDELDAALPELTQMSARYSELLRSGVRPVTASSRCTVALATVPVVAAHHPEAVVVWFDAHADLNTPDTTTTGYLGGLALSGPLGLWESGLGGGLDAGRIVLTGVRDIDPAEQEIIDSHKILALPPGSDLADRLRLGVGGRPVYLHIDCDVLDPGIIPTEYMVPNGLSLDDLHETAAALAECEVIGIEIGELEMGAEEATTRQQIDALLGALEPVLAAVS